MTAEARDVREAVELVYRPTAQDATEMLTARMRRTPSGRRLRWLLWSSGVAGALLAVVMAAGPGTGSPALVAGAGGLSGAAFGLLFLSPRLQARQVQRLAATHGEHRAVVDDSAVRWTTYASEVSCTWQALPRYTETPRLFVLFSGDRVGLNVACLPKRGISGPDGADRLRTLLDRNAERV
ncbi:YcxB family protein [Streptomyces sp. TRM64462]|uniref:YcxB family protein n=1 Tax=Streptomyces sp. TRM64462 TaxID=2741726 RepID=UPI001586DE74|nr:YcxB family protein [Streptomyces sp. TRM64462]